MSAESPAGRGRLAPLPYLADPTHRLLARDRWRGEGMNVGRWGEHLTVGILSCGRVAATGRLLRSIAEHLPNLAGEVLIVDNGTAPAGLARLRTLVAEQPYRTRLIELGRNTGVSAGRNRILEAARTEWVALLDDDLVLLGDPLPVIQDELSLLGCHILVLGYRLPGGPAAATTEAAPPADHVGVRLQDGEPFVEGKTWIRGHAAGPPFAVPHLATFVHAPCVVRRDTILGLGGFDEACFVGFEDTDLSIRVFQAGLKVGVSRSVAFEHDHQAPTDAADAAYESTRFSMTLLRRSAEHLDRKHGLRFWGQSVERWVEGRRASLGLAPDVAPAATRVATPTAGSAARTSSRPQVALLIDQEDWAFANIARVLSARLGDRFIFTAVPTRVLWDPHQVLLLTRSADLVHALWRGWLRRVRAPEGRQWVRARGGDPDRFERELVRDRRFSTGIYDHLLLAPDEQEAMRPVLAELVRGYCVASARLEAIYRDLPGIPPPRALLPDGVDLERFRPMRLERLRQVGARPLVIGWVGNSAWQGIGVDHKGVETVLRPAVERLRERGIPVITRFADRAAGFIPHARMPDYYASIDVLVCTSVAEGTPNPVLEAMASGVPVVSTDVGVVPEAFGPRQRAFIVARTPDAFAVALERLAQDPDELERLSAENLASIRAWSWDDRADAYGAYFEGLLAE